MYTVHFTEQQGLYQGSSALSRESSSKPVLLSFGSETERGNLLYGASAATYHGFTTPRLESVSFLSEPSHPIYVTL